MIWGLRVRHCEATASAMISSTNRMKAITPQRQLASKSCGIRTAERDFLGEVHILEPHDVSLDFTRDFTNLAVLLASYKG